MRCTNYQARVRSGRNIELSGGGSCYESCASSDTKIFGECFPRPTLTLSIAGVMDALADVMAFITGLPIVDTIMDAIDSVVGVVLRPVTNQIDRWVRDLGISPPAFPDINVNSIDFSGFNGISLPTFPNAQQFITAADRLNEKMLERLPAPFTNIGSCGADIDCISRQIGMGSLSDFASQMFDLVEEMDLSNMQEQMITYLEGFSCRRWNSYTVDVDQITRAIGLGSVSGACDIVFPYCDRVGNEVDPSGLNEAFQPVLNFVDALTGGRRLRGGSASRAGGSGSTWIPILGFEVQADYMGNTRTGSFGGQVSFSALRIAPDHGSQEVDAGDLLTDSRGTTHRRDRVLGMHIRGVAGFVFEIGILVRDGRPSVGIKFGPKVELKLGETGSALSRMKRVVGMYSEIRNFTNIDDDSPYYNEDFDKCRNGIRPAWTLFCITINNAATQSERNPPNDMSLTRMQRDMRQYELLDERNPDHLSMYELRQMTTYENQFQKCSNYWENEHKEIREKVVEAHGHQAEVDSFSVYGASGSPLFKKGLGKIIRDLSQLKLKSEWLARNLPGQTTASSALSFWNDIGEADDLLQLGIGVEMEDYDTGTRIGPIFQFKPKVDGTPFAGWNLGEMRVDTLSSILRSGANMVRGKDNLKRSLTEYTDKMYSITGTIDMLGIYDTFGEPDPRLNQVGGNPDTSVNKLQQCEGDCDRNSECAPGLVCLERNDGGQVPGCRGDPNTYVTWDYCITPGPQLTVVDSHKAVCGGGTGSYGEEVCHVYDPLSQPAGDSTTHEVRCCMEQGSWDAVSTPTNQVLSQQRAPIIHPNSLWQRRGGTCPSNVIGATRVAGTGYYNCVGNVRTWRASKWICENQFGGRLCTTQELQQDCTKGTGCGFDHVRVWSSDYDAVCGASENGGACGGRSVIPMRHDLEANYGVRCCASHAWQPAGTAENPCPWTTSGECQTSKTHAEAEQYCQGLHQDARLCTEDEVGRECAARSGCGFDDDLVWTRTPSQCDAAYASEGMRGDGEKCVQ